MSRVKDFSSGPLHIRAIVAFYLVFVGIISVRYNSGFGAAQPAIAN